LGEAEVEVLHPVVVADRKRQILGIHHLPLGNQVEVPDSLEDKLVALVAGRQAVEGVGKLVFQVEEVEPGLLVQRVHQRIDLSVSLEVFQEPTLICKTRRSTSSTR
jgi:hypothetical protein